MVECDQQNNPPYIRNNLKQEEASNSADPQSHNNIFIVFFFRFYNGMNGMEEKTSFHIFQITEIIFNDIFFFAP